jgi:hypothetical protein
LSVVAAGRCGLRRLSADTGAPEACGTRRRDTTGEPLDGATSGAAVARRRIKPYVVDWAGAGLSAVADHLLAAGEPQRNTPKVNVDGPLASDDLFCRTASIVPKQMPIVLQGGCAGLRASVLRCLRIRCPLSDDAHKVVRRGRRSVRLAVAGLFAHKGTRDNVRSCEETAAPSLRSMRCRTFGLAYGEPLPCKVELWEFRPFALCRRSRPGAIGSEPNVTRSFGSSVGRGPSDEPSRSSRVRASSRCRERRRRPYGSARGRIAARAWYGHGGEKGAALVDAAEEAMTTLGVRAPTRFARMLVPGVMTQNSCGNRTALE